MERDFDQINWYQDYKHQAKTFRLMNNELTDLLWNVNCACGAECLTKFEYFKLITIIYMRLIWLQVMH